MNEVLDKENIVVENMIYEIRGKQVMLDRDLARLYKCVNGTKTINQAVSRHLERFPSDFYFQLTKEEFISLQSQIGTTKTAMTRSMPFAFTEQGVAMLATIIKTSVASQISIAIMRAFVQVREYLMVASSVSAEIKELRSKVDLIQLQQEENLGAVNDLSEDVRQDIDNLYLAIADLSSRIEEKKNEHRPKIGFK